MTNMNIHGMGVPDQAELENKVYYRQLKDIWHSGELLYLAALLI